MTSQHVVASRDGGVGLPHHAPMHPTFEWEGGRILWRARTRPIGRHRESAPTQAAGLGAKAKGPSHGRHMRHDRDSTAGRAGSDVKDTLWTR